MQRVACTTEAENEAYGFDHADVGGVLMAKWDLADALVETVRYHHRIKDLKKHQRVPAV